MYEYFLFICFCTTFDLLLYLFEISIYHFYNLKKIMSLVAPFPDKELKLTKIKNYRKLNRWYKGVKQYSWNWYKNIGDREGG